MNAGPKEDLNEGNCKESMVLYKCLYKGICPRKHCDNLCVEILTETKTILLIFHK